MPAPRKPKPRTRTFTACLTCRSRKVKCDLGRPSCANCLRLKLDCAGYDAVLRWMPSWDPCGAGHRDHQPAAATAGCSVTEGGRKSRTELFSEDERRRDLSKLLRHLSSSPSSDDISSLLESLDEQISGLQHSLDTAVSSPVEMGPFNVFPSSDSSPAGAATPDLLHVGCPPPAASAPAEPPLAFPAEQPDPNAPFGQVDFAFDAPAQQDAMGGQQPLDVPPMGPEHEASTLYAPTDAGHQPSTFGHDDALASYHVPEPQVAPDALSHSLPVNPPPPASHGLAGQGGVYISPPTSRLSAGSPYLPPDIRFLLQHYDGYVIDSLSCVPIARDKAPWRHLHLPSAMRAYGELDILGRSSLFRVSLLYSVLSLTCYHLGSLYQPPVGPIGMPHGDARSGSADAANAEYWNRQARKFRRIGRTAFRKQLELSSRCRRQENYVESLMAAMSLVCIGIVSGEPWDARLYLLQCEAIIQGAEGTARQSSESAMQLYRILGFVKAIEETTFCHSRDEYLEMLQKDDFLPSEISLVRLSATGDNPSVRWFTTDAEHQRPDDACGGHQDLAVPGFSRLNGLPGSLLGMMTRTNSLIDRLSARAVRTGGSRFHIPPDLAAEAAELEAAICGWKKGDAEPGPPIGAEQQRTGNGTNQAAVVEPDGGSDDDGDGDEGGGRMAAGGDHHDAAAALLGSNMRTATYHALLVYFFREIRNTKPEMLQHYVARAVSCLESHQAVKTTFYPDKRVGTVVWPGFVAACEALDHDLRVRAIRCVRHAAVAGFRNGEVAEAVVRDLWQRRDAGDADVSWRDIVRQSKLFMLLS